MELKPLFIALDLLLADQMSLFLHFFYGAEIEVESFSSAAHPATSKPFVFTVALRSARYLVGFKNKEPTLHGRRSQPQQDFG